MLYRFGQVSKPVRTDHTGRYGMGLTSLMATLKGESCVRGVRQLYDQRAEGAEYRCSHHMGAARLAAFFSSIHKTTPRYFPPPPFTALALLSLRH
ncbi:hypothetical protein SLEP1_g10775 [Rubroshorea leprosula]|uniref:Uncharacterized protein n=1 Tax=Rubroshorea leprosula TaxID=152421 RepID=A0AAV5IDM6_9ROSI|nr:hypothetical protein SLEP1_g10775 [Rubroshorea leprosula]